MSQAVSSIFSLVDHEVFAITAQDGSRRSAMIATWVLPASIQAGYPECLFLSSPLNFTHELIMNSKRFVLHLLADHQAQALAELGLSSGRDDDKLTRVAHKITESGDIILKDTCGFAVCQLKDQFKLAERVALIGQVEYEELDSSRKALTKKAAFAALNESDREKLAQKQQAVARASLEWAKRERIT